MKKSVKEKEELSNALVCLFVGNELDFLSLNAAIRLLLENGADPNVLSEQHEFPPLYYVMEYEDARIENVRRGKEKEDKGKERESMEMIELLLEKGTDVNMIMDDKGEKFTFLSMARDDMGNKKIEKLLISKGAKE